MSKLDVFLNSIQPSLIKLGVQKESLLLDNIENIQISSELMNLFYEYKENLESKINLINSLNLQKDNTEFNWIDDIEEAILIREYNNLIEENSNLENQVNSFESFIQDEEEENINLNSQFSFYEDRLLIARNNYTNELKAFEDNYNDKVSQTSNKINKSINSIISLFSLDLNKSNMLSQRLENNKEFNYLLNKATEENIDKLMQLIENNKKLSFKKNSIKIEEESSFLESQIISLGETTNSLLKNAILNKVCKEKLTHSEKDMINEILSKNKILNMFNNDEFDLNVVFDDLFNKYFFLLYDKNDDVEIIHTIINSVNLLSKQIIYSNYDHIVDSLYDFILSSELNYGTLTGLNVINSQKKYIQFTYDYILDIINYYFNYSNSDKLNFIRSKIDNDLNSNRLTADENDYSITYLNHQIEKNKKANLKNIQMSNNLIVELDSFLVNIKHFLLEQCGFETKLNKRQENKYLSSVNNFVDCCFSFISSIQEGILRLKVNPTKIIIEQKLQIKYLMSELKERIDSIQDK